MPGELAPDRRNLRVSHEDRDEVAEQLRVAAGDGRLTAEELDERLETALTARTYGELEVLLTDLPASVGPARAPAPVPEAKELVELKVVHGTIRRDGPWVAPRRLAVKTTHGHVIVDFTDAVISQPTLDLSVTAVHGNIILIVPPEVIVDVDSVDTHHSNIHQRVLREPGTPVKLTVNTSGRLVHSNLVVRSPRGPRRSFWDWLLRRPAPPALTAAQGRALGR